MLKLTAFVQSQYKFPAATDPSIAQFGAMEKIMINAAQEVFINKGDVNKVLDQAGVDVKKAIEAK